jgi:pSer/pThr/pTyr-binding forkhead associated (FHA) protein
MIKCPECGVENTADSNYCRRCGAHLVISRDQEDTTEGHSARSRDVTDGAPADYLPLEGTVLQIRSPVDREGELLGLESNIVTIGRHPKSDLFLDDVTVSRRHARILIAPDGYTIEDEGSLNGTYVNRRRIESHQLFDGDEVQIGKFRLAFLEQKAEG